MILYLIGARGFTSHPMRRKLYEVSECMKRVCETNVVCGADIYPAGKAPITHVGSNTEYYSKWYRQGAFMRFLSQSFSEIRDIRHNHKLYQHISRSNKEYELIWERSASLICAGILYAKRNNIPSVLEWKDHLIKDYPSFFRPLARYIERWKNRNATFIAVESQVLKDSLVREGILAEKIFVTYNAVNPEEFSRDINSRKRVRTELGIDNTDLVVTYVGSYAFYHDSIRMIKAAKLIRDKGIDNIKWILVGDGKDFPICKKMANDEGLNGSSVFFIPPVPKEDVPKYLSAGDVSILPGSTDIICPIKVMEYMAAESVALLPDYECNREIIVDGVNGLLFKPFDENNLSAEICKLDDDRELINTIGKAARQYVCNNLTWDKTYGSVLKTILSINHSGNI